MVQWDIFFFGGGYIIEFICSPNDANNRCLIWQTVTTRTCAECPQHKSDCKHDIPTTTLLWEQRKVLEDLATAQSMSEALFFSFTWLPYWWEFRGKPFSWNYENIRTPFWLFDTLLFMIQKSQETKEFLSSAENPPQSSRVGLLRLHASSTGEKKQWVSAVLRDKRSTHSQQPVLIKVAESGFISPDSLSKL